MAWLQALCSVVAGESTARRLLLGMKESLLKGMESLPRGMCCSNVRQPPFKSCILVAWIILDVRNRRMQIKLTKNNSVRILCFCVTG